MGEEETSGQLDPSPQYAWNGVLVQIEAAPHKSFKAKLVSLGDKLYNLRDLDASPPSSWDTQRIQHYFTWSAQVCSLRLLSLLSHCIM